jgi:hypothetical protein
VPDSTATHDATSDAAIRRAVRARRTVAGGGAVILVVLGIVPLPLTPTAAAIIAGGVGVLALGLLVLGRVTYLAARAINTDPRHDATIGRLREIFADGSGLGAAVAVVVGSRIVVWVLMRAIVLTLDALRGAARRLTVLQAVGPGLAALMFLTIATCAYMAVWASAPDSCSPNFDLKCDGAFRGLGAAPTIGDFMYLAISGATGNTPPDAIPVSRLAHTTIGAEFIVGALLVGAYASLLFGRVQAEAASARGDAPRTDRQAEAAAQQSQTSDEPGPSVSTE